VEKKDWELLRDTAFNIAEINLQTERASEAETIEKAEFALQIDNARGELVNENILQDLQLISVIYIARGDIGNAVIYKRQFVNGVALMFGEDSLELAQQRAELGQFLLALKHNKEAQQNFDRAYQIVKANPDAPFNLRALILNSVGVSLFMNHEYDKCLILFKEIDSLYQDNIKKIELNQREKLASLYMSMGDVYIAKAQLNLADEYFQHALREEIVSGRMDDIDIPILLFKLGQVAQRQNHLDKQLRLFDRFTKLVLAHKPDEVELKQNILIIEVMLESAYKLFKEKGMSEMANKTGQYMQSIGMSIQ
jgi:tetratricopeptide (TPR) repeat protein